MNQDSKVDLTKAMQAYDRFLEKYEALNPEWHIGTLMRFLAGAYGSVQTYLTRGDYGAAATRIATTSHLEIGKPGDKPASVHLWRCEENEICCADHLNRQLAQLFHRQKLNAMLRLYVGPAIMWHQGTTETIFLPEAYQANGESLSPQKRIAEAKRWIQPYVIPLEVDLTSRKARERSVRLVGRVCIRPVVADTNTDLAYFPIDVGVKLVGMRPSIEARQLLSSLLLLLQQSFVEIAPVEQFPEPESPEAKVELPRSSAVTSVVYEKSADFRHWTLRFSDGAVHEWSLTRQQVPLVKAMWEFLHTDTHLRHFDDILRQADVTSYGRSRWHDKWRSRPGVFGSLVIGSGGYYGLNITPDQSTD